MYAAFGAAIDSLPNLSAMTIPCPAVVTPFSRRSLIRSTIDSVRLREVIASGRLLRGDEPILVTGRLRPGGRLR
jgi:hypothetical protein